MIGAAALAVSIAELPRYRIQTIGLLGAGALLVGAFLLAELRMKAAVLPRGVFRSGPLKWIYLTMSALMVAAMVTTYVPLFGQRLAHLTPMAAGFLSAALAVGWTASEIVSATLTNQRVIGRLIAAAPLVMASGLALGGLTQHRNASVATVAVWAVALLIAGTGIGIAWPHLTVRAMNSVDPAESRVAAAAINFTASGLSCTIGSRSSTSLTPRVWWDASARGSRPAGSTRDSLCWPPPAFSPRSGRRVATAGRRGDSPTVYALSRRDHRGQKGITARNGGSRPETAAASGAAPFTV